MAKPFRVQQAPVPIVVGRGDGGRFVRLESPTPAEVRAEAEDRGVLVDDIARETQVPLKPGGRAPARSAESLALPGGKPDGQQGSAGEPQQAVWRGESIPWPRAEQAPSGNTPFRNMTKGK